MLLGIAVSGAHTASVACTAAMLEESSVNETKRGITHKGFQIYCSSCLLHSQFGFAPRVYNDRQSALGYHRELPLLDYRCGRHR